MSKFTEIELEKAIELFKQGESYRSIGRILRRDPNTIRNHLKPLGYRKSQKITSTTNEKLQTAIELFEEGYSYTDIAKELGMVRSTITRQLKKSGYDRPLSVARINAVEIRNRQGKSYSCEFCESTFFPETGGKDYRFCSKKCWENYCFYTRVNYCKQCGKLLSPLEDSFCSENCRNNYKQAFCIDCKGPIDVGIRCKKCNERIYKLQLKESRFNNVRNGFKAEVRTCLNCGERYLYHYFHQSKSYCSEKCSSRYHKQNRRHKLRVLKKSGEYQDGITVEKLYIRDKGTCNNCGTECDFNDINYVGGSYITGQNYPSIDHIIPVSKGGSHTWNNVQLLCRKCNSIKGDKVEAL